MYLRRTKVDSVRLEMEMHVGDYEKKEGNLAQTTPQKPPLSLLNIWTRCEAKTPRGDLIMW